jgi:hypothetical protein
MNGVRPGAHRDKLSERLSVEGMAQKEDFLESLAVFAASGCPRFRQTPGRLVSM